MKYGRKITKVKTSNSKRERSSRRLAKFQSVVLISKKYPKDFINFTVLYSPEGYAEYSKITLSSTGSSKKRILLNRKPLKKNERQVCLKKVSDFSHTANNPKDINKIERGLFGDNK